MTKDEATARAPRIAAAAMDLSPGAHLPYVDLMRDGAYPNEPIIPAVTAALLIGYAEGFAAAKKEAADRAA